MRVCSFGIYGYRGRDDWEWNESLPDPSWAEIEAAIRRLDANEYAGLGFMVDDMHHDGGNQPSLHISGGRGQYVVSYSGGGGSSVHYVDPARANDQEMVGVVKRDQGVWVPAGWVCRDLELVVAIARHIVETGRPYRDVAWG